MSEPSSTYDVEMTYFTSELNQSKSDEHDTLADDTFISAFTSDAVISNMSLDNLRNNNKLIRMKSTEPISEGGLAMYSQEELCDLITAHRETLKEIYNEVENVLSDTPMSDPPSETSVDSTVHESSPTSELSDSPYHYSTSSSTANSNNNSKSDTKVVEMNNLSIRPKVFKTRMEVTFPALVRTFFAKMREWDEAITIIPFSGSAQNVLNNESNIPDDMEQASVWIRNTIDNDKWKYFAFQI